MSSLDGVQFRDYSLLWNKRLRALKGQTADIKVGDEMIPYDDIHKLYLDNAASANFMSTELGITDELVAKVDPNILVDKIRAASEYRENFFREAHFVKAFKEEYPKVKKRIKDPAIAKRNAAEAATFRVNKALFDYGALTKIERQGLRRIIPFYTYSRKVMPSLMEAMLLSPKNISRANRWLIEDERNQKRFGDMLIPPYQREIGYTQLSGGEEPWILNSSFLPLSSPFGEYTNLSSAQGWTQNLLANTNPFIKAVSELGLGRTAFDGREVESTSDYIANSFFPYLRPTADIATKLGGKDVLSNVPGLDKVPGLGNFKRDNTKDWAEIGLSNRFALGLPFDKIKENQQTAALYTMNADIKRELSKVNDKVRENGLRIYLSERKEGTSIRVRDEESGQVLFESTDAKAAADFATRASNAKKKFRSSP